MSRRAFLLMIGVLSTPFLLGDAPNDDCFSKTRTQRITAKHREGNGIGYPTGYSTVEGFFSTSRTPNLIGFADVRAHISNNGKKAYNAGLGLRGLSEATSAVFGLNVFYDYRDARHRAFNQIGVGIEILGRRWDIRANGYIPVHHIKKKYSDEFLHFKANSAIFSKRYEFAFIGGELAFGKELFKAKYWDLHAKLAAYWFNGAYGKNAGGGLFELATNITRYLTLKGQVSYDSLFREIFQGEVAINVPLGWRFDKTDSSLCCKYLRELEDRLVESVDRFEMIVTSIKRKKTPAIDPLTGQTLKFIFVDNTSHSLGTFESPYPTLTQAQNASAPGNVIYVFRGDGTTKGLNTGITLKNNQALIGSAAPLTVTTRFGVRTIPAQTLNTPVMTNSTNVVTLANNNQVSGFTLISPNGANAINGSGIVGAKINNNLFMKTAGEDSVFLNTFAGGNLEVVNNTFTGVGTGIDFTVSGNATGTVSNNIFTCTGQAMSFIGACNYTATAGTQVFTFDSNQFIVATFAAGQQAINFLTLNSSDVTINITNSFFTNFSGAGGGNAIAVLAEDNSTCKTLISKNVISNTGNSSIFLEAVFNAQLILDVQDNLSTNASDGSPGTPGITIDSSSGTGDIIITRFVGNTSFTANPSSPGTTFFTETGNAFFVQSPNGQLSGVQEFNLGSITVNTTAGGQVIFSPLTYGPLF